MKQFWKILNVVCVFSLAVLLWSGQAQASPLFSLDSYSEWDTAVGGGPGGIVAPVATEHASIAAHYGPLAADYVYVTPTITAMTAATAATPGLDDGLLMSWGDTGAPNDVLQVAAWEYTYDIDPDLTGTSLSLSVMPPTGILSVSLTLIDQVGGSGHPGPGMLFLRRVQGFRQVLNYDCY